LKYSFKKLATAAVLSFLALNVCAQEKQDPATLEIIKQMPMITDAVQLPDGPYNAIQNNEGQIFFMNPSGRFVIAGIIYDAWEKRPLMNVEEMRYAFSHVRPENMGVKTADLQPIVIGSGKKHVQIFADPLCHWCEALIGEVQADKGLQKDYTFEILMVPALGDQSELLARQLYCAKEKDPAKLLEAVKTKKIGQLEQQENCSRTAFDKRLIFAQMLGIKSVPFVVGPDGRFVTGKPASLREWLDQGDAVMKAEAQRFREALQRASGEIRAQAEKADKANKDAVQPATPKP